MVAATLLALTAAAIHAGWNLLAKRSADRFLALWGQFFVAAVLSVPVLLVTRDLPASAWAPAALTGLIHIPYTVCLASAYDRGDFSVAYPIARGSGATLAAVGGVIVLGDHLGAWSLVAIGIAASGMMLLAAGAHLAQVVMALAVGTTIAAYTVNDSEAVRDHGVTYSFALFVATGVAITLLGVVTGRSGAMQATMRTSWRSYALTGAMAATTYLLVMIAVRRAPVGYVAALRESSVVIAALLGARYLAEPEGRRRTLAAAVVLAGLVLLVASA